MRDETGVAPMCKIASSRRDTKARRDWEGAVSIGPHIPETVASSQCRRVLSPSAIALLSLGAIEVFGTFDCWKCSWRLALTGFLVAVIRWLAGPK